MRLNKSLAASALFFTAFAPGSIANPMDSSEYLVNRAATLSQGACVSPSQIDLSQSRTSDSELGSCNWKEWALCTAIAAGACFVPCEVGGYVNIRCFLSYLLPWDCTDADRVLGSRMWYVMLVLGQWARRAVWNASKGHRPRSNYSLKR